VSEPFKKNGEKKGVTDQKKKTKKGTKQIVELENQEKGGGGNGLASPRRNGEPTKNLNNWAKKFLQEPVRKKKKGNENLNRRVHCKGRKKKSRRFEKIAFGVVKKKSGVIT